MIMTDDGFLTSARINLWSKMYRRMLAMVMAAMNTRVPTMKPWAHASRINPSESSVGRVISALLVDARCSSMTAITTVCSVENTARSSPSPLPSESERFQRLDSTLRELIMYYPHELGKRKQP